MDILRFHATSSPFRFQCSQKLSLLLREISLLSESVNKEEPQTKPTKKAFDVLLPCLALAYLPFVFLVGTVSDGVDSYIVFVLSGAALLVLLPAYAVTIVLRAKERIRNGTNTPRITLFQIFPLAVFIIWIIAVLSFGGSPV